MNILVSVIVPVYNVQNYLDKCISSIVNQTYSQLQIILVDDGSTDESGKKCDEWVNKDPRIKVIHKENGGLVSARKVGSLAAEGNYLMHVDSDDWIEADMIESMLKIALDHDADVVTAGCKKEYPPSDNIDDYPEVLAPGLYEGQSLIDLMTVPFSYQEYGSLEFRFRVYVCSKLYRTSLFKEAADLIPDSIINGEDAAFTFSCFLKAKRIFSTGKNWYHYVLRGDSLSYTVHPLSAYDALESYLLSLSEKFSDTFPTLKSHLLAYVTYARLHGAPETVVQIRDNVIFPFEKVTCGEKVAFYGASNVGIGIRKYIEEQGLCTVLAHGDRQKLPGIISPEEIVQRQGEFDHILISVVAAMTGRAIERSLIEKGVDPDKLCRLRILPVV